MKKTSTRRSMRVRLTLLFAILLTPFISNKSIAQCSLPLGTTLASNFFATIGTCTGVITIPSGAKLDMDVNLTLPASITELIVANGGQIIFDANTELHLNENSVLNIVNQTITNPNNPAAAVYAPQACNNNKAIYVGSLKYSACTGGGNVCLIYNGLIAQGGTLKITPTVNISGIQITNGRICTNNAANTVFTLQGILSQNSGFKYQPTYEWSVIASPGSTTFSSTTTNPTTVTATSVGQHIIRLTVHQNLSTVSCETTVIQTKYVDFPLNIILSPTATISGGGHMYHNPTPTSSRTVTFTGSGGGTPEYMISYTLNEVAQTPVSTVGGEIDFTKFNDEPIGSQFDYVITGISDTNCSTTLVSPTATITVGINLPVELKSFDVKVESCDKFITWESSEEDNVAYYEIQSSADGKNFSTLDRVKANGSNSKYNFTDRTNKSKTTFYQLKIVDIDGKISYSTKVVKGISNCSNISIFPTESNGKYNITGLEESGLIEVISMEGRAVQTFKYNSNNTTIDLQNYPVGLYNIIIKSEGTVIHNSKVIKF